MTRKIDETRHYETPDPTPVSIPSGFRRPETLQEQIRRLIRSDRFNEDLDKAGFETFAEANDFDIEDDPVDPSTPYEPYFDPALGHEVTPAQVIADEKLIREQTEQNLSLARARQKAAEAVKAPAGTTPADPPVPPPESQS